MRVLWDSSPLLSREIVQIIIKKSTWNNKTIETLLRRLVDKGAVGFNFINSKVRKYYPIVSEEECIKVESETFLKKLYNGSLSMMLTGFLKHQKLSKAEIQKLKKIIDSEDE